MISIRNYINGILVLLMSVAPITLQAQIVSFEAVRSALGSNEAARIENDIMIVGHVINSQGNPNLRINCKSRLVNLVLLPLWYGNKDIIRDNISKCHR